MSGLCQTGDDLTRPERGNGGANGLRHTLARRETFRDTILFALTPWERNRARLSGQRQPSMGIFVWRTTLHVFSVAATAGNRLSSRTTGSRTTALR